jgi:type IV pilus assembly protein PilA
MSIRKKLKGGFTLVELMIVVAIVGVLAVLAVYGVRKYIANAKTAEAKNSLGQMGKDANTAFEGERMTASVLSEGSSAGIVRQLCDKATASVPSSKAPIKGSKYQSTKAEWSNATDVASNRGFPCLRFEMTQPQYYMYSYYVGGDTTTSGGWFSGTANGDLNGDGTLSTFSVTGTIQPSGRLNVAPSIFENSPEE